MIDRIEHLAGRLLPYRKWMLVIFLIAFIGVMPTALFLAKLLTILDIPHWHVSLVTRIYLGEWSFSGFVLVQSGHRAFNYQENQCKPYLAQIAQISYAILCSSCFNCHAHDAIYLPGDESIIYIKPFLLTIFIDRNQAKNRSDYSKYYD